MAEVIIKVITKEPNFSDKELLEYLIDIIGKDWYYGDLVEDIEVTEYGN